MTQLVTSKLTWCFSGLRLTLTAREYTEWIGTESYYDSEAKEHKSRDTQFHGDNEILALKQWLYGDRKDTFNFCLIIF